MKKLILPLGICLSVFTYLEADSLFSGDMSAQDLQIPVVQKEGSMPESMHWEKISLKVTKPFSKRDKKALLHGHVHESSLKWDWGLRDGIKYNGIEEEWLIAGTYTHFHSKSYASLENEGWLIPTWQKEESSKAKEMGSSAASRWRLDVEIGDIEAGKTFKVREYLSIRPHVGIRAALMNQNFDINYEKFERGVLKEPAFWNNSLGFGGRGGVDTSFQFGKGVSFYGDGALSLLKTYHNIHESALDRNIGIAIAEFSLGLRYEKNFMNSLCLLTMKVGYEFNHFFNQQRWANWFSPLAQTMSYDKISFQGFSTGFRLDF